MGLRLPEIVSGLVTPDELAESLEVGGAWKQYHSNSPSTAPVRAALHETIGGLLDGWPADRPIRILEIGNQTLFHRLEPVLPKGRFHYVFAHDDVAVLDEVRVEFSGHPGLVVCGLESDMLMPSDEEAVRRRYDLILVQHAVSRAPDPRLALRNLKRMLALDGVLAVSERRPDRWSAMAAGLRGDWWQGGNGARARQPVPEHWKGLLEEVGFADPDLVFEPHGDASTSGSYVVLARNPDLPEVLSPFGVAPSTWLFLVDCEGWGRPLADELSARLEESGHTVLKAEPGKRFERLGETSYTFASANRQGLDPLLRAVAEDAGGCDHIVHLMGLEGEVVHEDPLHKPASRCLSALQLLRFIRGDEGSPPPRLWLVTRGAATYALPPEVSTDAPDQAALWGLGRVIMNEHPELDCTLIDLQTDEAAADLSLRLEEELLLPDGEDEVILARGGERLVSRLRAVPVSVAPSLDPVSARLDFTHPGPLKNLEWRPTPLAEPGPDQVEILTQATGLNFRDVMYAMGLLSDEALENGFGGAGLGMEVAGRVSRVGVSVDGFSPGDEVVAFTPSGFSGTVVTHAGAVALKPPDWTFEGAATVPTVFFTSWYALHHLARLQPGERVLIHGAAGGVGISAIQVARHLGAEIFATAGSDEKRDFVRLMGVDHVMDSRSLAFADEILEMTGGEGVDVVLNSLAGEALRRSFQALRPFGRFLELGKRDFYENTRLGLRPFKDNISYFGIDADQLMADRPALAAHLFREVMDLFSRGVFRPLPYRSFPASRVVDAFRFMQQSQQIGKVVVTFDGGDELSGPPSLIPSKPPALDPEGCYLVTGGTSGFGLRTAVWLAEQGAGHILLLSRSGEDAPEAATARAEIEAQGAKAHIRACDVEDMEALGAVFAECGGALPGLRGVVHAATVLEDGLLRNIDDEQFLRSMAPKVRGAWNLHALTRDLSLDLFVLYSSATTSIGNPGQGGYVAANLYLEALAAKRRARGLPGTCVAWGPIGDVGYLARNPGVKNLLLARVGGAGLESRQSLDVLGRMLGAGASQLTVWNLDWNAVSRALPSAASSRFAEPRQQASERGMDLLDGGNLGALIAGKDDEEARDIVADLVTELIAQILRLPKERIPLDGSLYGLGMDSLMGVELVLAMEQKLGVTLPTLALAEEPSVRRIAERLIGFVRGGAEAGSAGSGSSEEALVRGVVSSMAASHDIPATSDQVEMAVEELMRKKATS